MTTPQKTYNASYTSGGLLQRETTAVLPLILIDLTCGGFLPEKRENRYLQINSEVARRKVLDEIRKRVRQSNADVWTVYETADETERSLLLYYLCLKTYRLLWVFHFDVLVARWRSLQRTLDPYDLKQKLDELSTAHTEVEAWTDKTQSKIVQVSRLMMVKAGFLTGDQLRKPSVLLSFYAHFVQWGDGWMLEAALLSEPERKIIMTEVV